VKLLEIKLDRNHFTRHGLHLNFKGKELVSQELAMMVEQFFKKKQKAPIPIPWKVPLSVATDFVTQDLTTNDEITKTPQPFQHRRNCPAWRNPDFLWIKMLHPHRK
jgi:hypothetical protein